MKHQKEIEAKMEISSQEQFAQIKAYINSLTHKNDDPWKEINMKAVYYDTKEGSLQKYKAAYRVRQENKSIVATYKQGISNKNGIAERIEVNKLVQNLTPDISIFKNETAVWPFIKRLEGKIVIPIVMTDFVRKALLIDWQGSKIEVSLDLGTITGGNKQTPICELELELKTGLETALVDLETKINNEFNLVPSTISKYKKGLILAGL